MSHSIVIIQNSLLEIFDPASVEYAGVRDHFTPHQLARIDEFRNRPVPSSFTFDEKIFICWALDKAVMSAENP